MEIALAWRNFLNSVVSADILFCLEISVFIGRIGIGKLAVLVQSVNCSHKRSVALCRRCFRILLCHFNGKLFEDIFECLSCGCVSRKGCSLLCWNYISYGNIFLGNGVHDLLIIAVVNGNIGKDCNTVRTCFNCVGLTVARNSKLSVSVLIILRLFIDLYRARFKLIVELHIHSQINISACQRNILSLWNFVSCIYIDLGYGVGDRFARRCVVYL